MTFADLEKILIERHGIMEKEEIGYAIEAFKEKISEDQIDELRVEIDNFIESRVIEIVDNEYGWENSENIKIDFFKTHPEYSEVSEDDMDDDMYKDYMEAFQKFKDNLTSEQMQSYVLDVYEGLRDNITDEIRRTATSDAAEEFNVSLWIIREICHNALG